MKHKLRGGNYGFGRELRIQEEITSTEWEGITDVGKNYRVVRNSKWQEILESGEMHELEEIAEPAKVQGYRVTRSEFQVRGNHKVRQNCRFAAKLQKWQNDEKYD